MIKAPLVGVSIVFGVIRDEEPQKPFTEPLKEEIRQVLEDAIRKIPGLSYMPTASIIVDTDLDDSDYHESFACSEDKGMLITQILMNDVNREL